MRLTLPSLKIGETDGFDNTDLFGLAEFGDRLANLVCNLEDPLVIALDGPWGSGKSTFVQQWAGLLRRRHIPVILFDAFANDHQDDAFIALAGEITALADAKREAARDFLSKAKKVGRVLTPLTVRALMRAATLGLLATEDLESLGADVQAAIKDTASDASAVTESLIEERLKKAKEDRDTVEAFRKSLSALARQLAGSTKPESGGTLVVIIDELDRCRPPFALNVLERVKHLFSVENVCFVLVAHLPQLEAVVRSSYGLDVDARAYLEKFFHLRVTLPEPISWAQSDRISKYILRLWNLFGLNANHEAHGVEFHDSLLALGQAHNLSLRTLERIMTHVVLILSTNPGRFRPLLSLVVGLCVMKQVRPGLFEKARSGTLEWSCVNEFLKLDAWKDAHFAEHFGSVWRFTTADQLQEDEDWTQSVTSILRMKDQRKQLIPSICNDMDNLHIFNI